MSQLQGITEGSVVSQRTVLQLSPLQPKRPGSDPRHNHHHLPTRNVLQRREGEEGLFATAMTAETQLRFNLTSQPDSRNLATSFKPTPSPVVIQSLPVGSCRPPSSSAVAAAGHPPGTWHGTRLSCLSAERLALAVKLARRDLRAGLVTQRLTPHHVHPPPLPCHSPHPHTSTHSQLQSMHTTTGPLQDREQQEARSDSHHSPPLTLHTHTSTHHHHPHPVPAMVEGNHRYTKEEGGGGEEERDDMTDVIRLKGELANQVQRLRELGRRRRELEQVTTHKPQKRKGVGGRVEWGEEESEVAREKKRAEEQAARSARMLYSLHQQVRRVQEEIDRLNRRPSHIRHTKKSQAVQRLSAAYRAASRILQHHLTASLSTPHSSHPPLPPELVTLIQQLCSLGSQLEGGVASEGAVSRDMGGATKEGEGLVKSQYMVQSAHPDYQEPVSISSEPHVSFGLFQQDAPLSSLLKEKKPLKRPPRSQSGKRRRPPVGETRGVTKRGVLFGDHQRNVPGGGVKSRQRQERKSLRPKLSRHPSHFTDQTYSSLLKQHPSHGKGQSPHSRHSSPPPTSTAPPTTPHNTPQRHSHHRLTGQKHAHFRNRPRPHLASRKVKFATEREEDQKSEEEEESFGEKGENRGEEEEEEEESFGEEGENRGEEEEEEEESLGEEGESQGEEEEEDAEVGLLTQLTGEGSVMASTREVKKERGGERGVKAEREVALESGRESAKSRDTTGKRRRRSKKDRESGRDREERERGSLPDHVLDDLLENTVEECQRLELLSVTDEAAGSLLLSTDLQALLLRLGEMEEEEEQVHCRWTSIAYEDHRSCRSKTAESSRGVREPVRGTPVAPHPLPLFVPTHTLSSIQRYREAYSRYLTLSGMRGEGGGKMKREGRFNPWMMVESIADDILDDVMGEVSEELGEICDYAVTGLYSDEFMKP